jgi:hypothetical protein
MRIHLHITVFIRYCKCFRFRLPGFQKVLNDGCSFISFLFRNLCKYIAIFCEFSFAISYSNDHVDMRGLLTSKVFKLVCLSFGKLLRAIYQHLPQKQDAASHLYDTLRKVSHLRDLDTEALIANT